MRVRQTVIVNRFIAIPEVSSFRFYWDFYHHVSPLYTGRKSWPPEIRMRFGIPRDLQRQKKQIYYFFF